MVMYIKMKKVNPYAGNTAQFHNLLKEHTSHICSVLKLHIPENAIGHSTSLAYLSDNIIKNVPQCIWGLMVNNIHVLRYFADPDYINSILELGAAFAEWEDFSYWHETGVAYSKGERLWTLFFRESSSPLHGMYIGQTFEAGKDNETFIPKENFSLIFWNKENDDDEFAVIQACNIINSAAEDYTVYYGLYKYDDVSNEITIKWNDGNENFLNIPSRLKRITGEKPAERDEQVWWNIIRKFDDNNSLKLFTETLLDRLNTEYLDDDYAIKDVTISRKLFTLTIETTDGIKEYSIPIDAYPFLRNLRVFDEVTIKKDTRTEELFVSWPWAGYEIPLSEFKINREKPAERDEQVWWNIIRKFDDNNSLKLFTETLLDRLNTEYLDDDYAIKDVTISRKLFTLTIETTDGIKEYSIPIDAYPFLRNLRVFDEVTIKKDTRTEELFVSWPWAGYEIPLSEFKINM